MARLTGCCLWFYAALAAAAWAALRWGGDRWWWATILLFCPRWIWAAPLALLVPGMLIWRRRLWWLAAATSLWVAGPLMGFCVAWPLTTHHSPLTTHPLRVMTCNVGLGGFDERALAKYLMEAGPDVIVLQEGITPEWFTESLGSAWHLASCSEMVVASKFRILDQQVLSREPLGGWGVVALACRLATPHGEVEFVALHLYTPRKGLAALKEDRFDGIDAMRKNLVRRTDESAAAAAWVRTLPGPLIVAGDMNLPPESAIYRRDWSHLRNAFAEAGWGYGYTYGYTKSGACYGIRIDHVLAGSEWQIKRCWVGPDVGSDHRPVIADLVRQKTAGEGSSGMASGEWPRRKLSASATQLVTHN